jgi:hypothetical protein
MAGSITGEMDRAVNDDGWIPKFISHAGPPRRTKYFLFVLSETVA